MCLLYIKFHLILHLSYMGESVAKEMRKLMHRKGQNQVFKPGSLNSQLRPQIPVLSTDPPNDVMLIRACDQNKS